MLLAAGHGTRLSPLTDYAPKPAVPFGQTIVGHRGLEAFAEAGIRRVVANAGRMPGELETALRAHTPEGVALRISRERRVLGTGGGIRHALGAAPSDHAVIHNGDIVSRFGLSRAMRAHLDERAFATMIVTRLPDTGAAAPVEIDESGRVVRVRGRGPAVGIRCAFSGVHILSPDAIGSLPSEGCVVGEGYLGWLRRGLRVRAVVEPAGFTDVGTLRAYLDAQTNAHATVHRLATTKGAFVTGSTLGAHARIDAGVRVIRSVVWPHTRVVCDLVDAVAGPFGVVRA